jgi:hypothetical protein
VRTKYEKEEKRPNGKEASGRPYASPCAMCGVVCAGLHANMNSYTYSSVTGLGAKVFLEIEGDGDMCS